MWFQVLRSDINWAQIKKVLDCIVSNLSQGAFSEIWNLAEFLATEKFKQDIPRSAILKGRTPIE